MNRIGRTDVWDRGREEMEWHAWDPAERFRSRWGKHWFTHRCSRCDVRFGGSEEPVEHPYSAHDLRRVVLRRGVVAAQCPKCQAWHWRARAEPQLRHVLALALIARSGNLVGSEIRFVRLQSHIPQRALAGALRMRRATVADWERAETRSPNPGTELLLRAVLLGYFRSALERFGLHRLNMEHLDFLRGIERRLILDYERIIDSNATGPVFLRWTGANYWTVD